MTTDPGNDIPAKGSLPWPRRHSGENQSSGCNEHAHAPPADGLEYGLLYDAPASSTPRYALMAYTENFARAIGTQIFGKW